MIPYCYVLGIRGGPESCRERLGRDAPDPSRSCAQLLRLPIRGAPEPRRGVLDGSHRLQNPDEACKMARGEGYWGYAVGWPVDGRFRSPPAQTTWSLEKTPLLNHQRRLSLNSAIFSQAFTVLNFAGRITGSCASRAGRICRGEWSHQARRRWP